MGYDRSSLARTPVKGLRVKLRNKLRELGYLGKFSVDHHRRLGLVVHGDQPFPDLTVFEGIEVKFVVKNRSIISPINKFVETVR